MLYYARGSASDVISEAEARAGLVEALEQLGPRQRVIAIPPDASRMHSQAGPFTRFVYDYYGEALRDILPAIGTHTPMTPPQIEAMYPGVPAALFRKHDWRNDIVTLGEVPAEVVREASAGAIDTPWPAQVNRRLPEGGYDLMLSIGQVVPHEVVGMANHSKNIFVGTGGAAGINASHFLGAAFGMERIMGRTDTPVRRVLDAAADRFLADWPLVYVQTVIGRTADHQHVLRGVFIGDDRECFERAAALSREVNLTLLASPLSKVVVNLDPAEFRSTWLGNKSIYRTRMAMADAGELIVLAPGVETFGEDPEIDRLIRDVGYVGTPAVMEAVRTRPDLAANLGAAAHLIHGSSEGRFTVTYCPGHLSRAEIEGVGFRYADLATLRERYDPARLHDGVNTLPDGETIYYISNPALGLWAWKERF